MSKNKTRPSGDGMLELDLHGMRVAEAMRAFIDTYNRRVARGDLAQMRVVHGYGSEGGEGAIGRELRRYLARHAVEFMAGEDFSINPGFTVVYPRKLLPPCAVRRP